MTVRRVCFVVTSHIHYARSRLVMAALRDHPRLELVVAVGGSAILPHYGNALAALERDGFTANARIRMTIAGGDVVAMAKTTGHGISEFATALDMLAPDIVVLRGDRYEVLAAGVAAAYMNIPIAHIEGGDVSGSIDESVRHALTKLAHIHFATNAIAAARIRRMGEDPAYVFDVGCPEVEVAARCKGDIDSATINAQGVGADVDLSRPYLVVMHHPVTTETATNRTHTRTLLEAVDTCGVQAIWFWPNVDAGTDEVAKAIRVYREQRPPAAIRFAKYLLPDRFLALLAGAACLIGNSSAGIKEASFLGVPTINIGTRQSGRMRGPNVMDIAYDGAALADAIARQLDHGPYPSSDIYHGHDTAETIAETLASIALYTQKRFHDEEPPVR